MNVTILFYFFSICLVICASIVIISKHPVLSIVFLAFSFIFLSFLLFLLECELLALLFLIIYLGAILILFLFAVMMLESKAINLFNSQIKFISPGLVFSNLLLSCFLIGADLNFFTIKSNYLDLNAYYNWFNLIDCFKDVQVYGQVLYSYYVLQLLILGLILMLILVSIVHLTNSFYRQETNDQSIFKQISRNLLFLNNF